MSLYKTKKSPYWQTEISVNGQRVRRSTKTKNRKQAQAFEDRLRRELWDYQFDEHAVWEDAVVRWLDENEHKRAADKDRIILQWFAPHLNGLRLQEINRDLLLDLRRQKAEETSRSTANRYMALIRAILNACRDEWEWLSKVPKVPMFPTERTDYEWLTQDEFDALLPHLPEHTRQLARFAVATGLRRTNITHLQWRQVDMRRKHVHILGAESKSKKPIPVPLNADALQVLREQQGAHKVWVFPYLGEPVYQVATKAWRKAVKKIGRPGFRFHDLRHTWASWHVQAGTPLHVLQQLGGWSSYEMVLRYAHLDRESLASYADNICQKIAPTQGGNGEAAA